MSHDRIVEGEPIRDFVLPEIDGRGFHTEDLRGRRYLLSLFRFASCPFCNMRVHELVSRWSEFPPDFGAVGVFDSSLENLRRYGARHEAPFPLLADDGGAIHGLYAVEHSMSGVLRGMVTRAPTMLSAMSRGFLPTRIDGVFTGMPVDLLVDEEGIVQRAYYGRDEGDHIPLDEVLAFARSAAPRNHT